MMELRSLSLMIKGTAAVHDLENFLTSAMNLWSLLIGLLLGMGIIMGVLSKLIRFDLKMNLLLLFWQKWVQAMMHYLPFYFLVPGFTFVDQAIHSIEQSIPVIETSFSVPKLHKEPEAKEKRQNILVKAIRWGVGVVGWAWDTVVSLVFGFLASLSLGAFFILMNLLRSVVLLILLFLSPVFLLFSFLGHAFQYSPMENSFKAWLSYVLPVWLSVIPMRIIFLAGVYIARHFLVDHPLAMPGRAVLFVVCFGFLLSSISITSRFITGIVRGPDLNPGKWIFNAIKPKLF